MKDAIMELNSIKDKIPVNTYRTLLSQIKMGGDRMEGALVGIRRIKYKLSKGVVYVRKNIVN